MNKHIRNYLASWIVFIAVAATYLAVVPAHPEWRVALTAALIASIAFNIISAWRHSPGIAYYRAQKAAAAAEPAE